MNYRNALIPNSAGSAASQPTNALETRSNSNNQSQLDTKSSSVSAANPSQNVKKHRNNTMPSLSVSPFANNSTVNSILTQSGHGAAVDYSAIAAQLSSAATQNAALSTASAALQNDNSSSSANSAIDNIPGSLNCILVQFTSGRTDTYYLPLHSANSAVFGSSSSASDFHHFSSHHGHGNYQQQQQHLQQQLANISVGDYVVVEADRGEDLGRVIMDNINIALPRRSSVSVAMSNAAAQQQQQQMLFSSNLGNSGDFLPGEYGLGGSGGSSENSSANPSPTFELEECLSSSSFSSPCMFANGVAAGGNQTGSVGGASSAPSVSNMPKKIYRVAAPLEIESLLAKVRDEMNAIAVGQYKVQEWKLPMQIIDAEYQWDRRKLTFFFSVTLPSVFPNQPSPRIDFRTLVRDLYQIYRTRIWMYCVDKDKNRVNRQHLREKFLKTLYKDTVSRSSAPSLALGSSAGNGFSGISSAVSTAPSTPSVHEEEFSYAMPVKPSTSLSSSVKSNVSAPQPRVSSSFRETTNSLKAVLEEASTEEGVAVSVDDNDEWDISEVLKFGTTTVGVGGLNSHPASPLYGKKIGRSMTFSGVQSTVAGGSVLMNSGVVNGFSGANEMYSFAPNNPVNGLSSLSAAVGNAVDGLDYGLSKLSFAPSTQHHHNHHHNFFGSSGHSQNHHHFHNSHHHHHGGHFHGSGHSHLHSHHPAPVGHHHHHHTGGCEKVCGSGNNHHHLNSSKDAGVIGSGMVDSNSVSN